MTTLVVAVFSIVCLFYIGDYLYQKQKRKRLMLKYNDTVLVNKLMRKIFWQGETADQLLESLGAPVEVQSIVLKTKTKRIWKYDRTGKNRFDLKITLENDIVVGWDQK